MNGITQETIDAASEAAREIDRNLKFRYVRAGVYESTDGRFAIHDTGWKRAEWFAFDRVGDCYVGQHGSALGFDTKANAIDAIKRQLRRETPACRVPRPDEDGQPNPNNDGDDLPYRAWGEEDGNLDNRGSVA